VWSFHSLVSRRIPLSARFCCARRQCSAICCSLLQSVAVCCSVWMRSAMRRATTRHVECAPQAHVLRPTPLHLLVIGGVDSWCMSQVDSGVRHLLHVSIRWPANDRVFSHKLRLKLSKNTYGPSYTPTHTKSVHTNKNKPINYVHGGPA